MKDFVRWYDLLFIHKKYKEEVQLALALIQQQKNSHESMLEIGAGTGNHTLHLALNTKKLFAVEIDKDMAYQGKEKTKHFPHVFWHTQSLEELFFEPVSAVIALFYMINYIKAEESLSFFLKTIYQKMKKGGVFIFDCWHKEKMLIDNNWRKIQNFTYVDFNIQKNMLTTLDRYQKIAELDYKIKISQSDFCVGEFNEKVSLRLWGKDELLEFARLAGFTAKVYDTEGGLIQSAPGLWFILIKE